jgi:fructokinase
VIHVAGEALVDLLVAPDGDVRAALGGAPFNTARALGRLGAEVRFVGALSTDRFGHLLRDRLVGDGVDVGGPPPVELPTTLAVAELDADGAATYRFYIDGTSAPALTDLGVDGGTWFTGGLGLVLEPMASAIERALTGGRHDALMVDVNCRPLVVPDRDRYVARIGRIVDRATVVKVSEDDLAYLSPGADPVIAARALLAGGPTVVLLTAGAAGVRVMTPDGERHVPAVAADVVDTVGAGDTFGAGFLAHWTADGHPTGLDRLEAAAAFGAQVAAVVVSRAGADPPWSHEL